MKSSGEIGLTAAYEYTAFGLEMSRESQHNGTEMPMWIMRACGDSDRRLQFAFTGESSAPNGA